MCTATLMLITEILRAQTPKGIFPYQTIYSNKAVINKNETNLAAFRHFYAHKCQKFDFRDLRNNSYHLIIIQANTWLICHPYWFQP